MKENKKIFFGGIAPISIDNGTVKVGPQKKRHGAGGHDSGPQKRPKKKTNIGL